MALGFAQIQEHLSDQDIVRLHRELVVPMAVHDILKGQTQLDDVAEYTIDSNIGELPVDAALLCLALSAAHIAEDLSGAHPTAGALAIESARIVHDYGPVWLAHADGALNGEDLIAIQNKFTDQIVEDFESLGDLLKTCGGDMPDHSDQYTLCALMADHADAYASYTNMTLRGEDLDIFMESMDDAPSLAAIAAAPIAAQSIQAGNYGNNVVMFPGTLKNG